MQRYSMNERYVQGGYATIAEMLMDDDGEYVLHADVLAERERFAVLLRHCRAFIAGPMSVALPGKELTRQIDAELSRLRGTP